MNGAELIHEMVDQQPVAFENMVLARYLLDPPAARVMSGVLFTSHDKLEMRSFSMPENDGLGRVIWKYHEANAYNAEPRPQVLQFALGTVINEGRLAGDAGTMWAKLLQLSVDGAANWSSVLHCTKAGMGYWLEQQRMKFVTSLSQTKQWTAEKLLTWLRQERAHVSSLAVSRKLDHDMWGALNSRVTDVVRIPCSIPRLNYVLGGGFGRSEATLNICPTGGGKTVLSTQLTGEWCTQGLKGIYVTTERTQPASKLALRILSQQCDIPFKQIKDGLNIGALQPVQQQAIQQLQQHISANNLRFVQWFDLPNPNDIEQLREIVERYVQELQGLDFFILDWLGGALEVSTDKDKRRLLYGRGADLTAEVASIYDCSALVLAQAHENARNKVRVTAADAQENKSLGNNMTNIMGTSAMMAKDHDASGEGANYERDQFFNLSKTRGGEGGLVPVLRFFEKQKFKPRVGSST